MSPEQHDQQRVWVAQSLQAEAQRQLHHDTYPRRAPRVTASAERRHADEPSPPLPPDQEA